MAPPAAESSASPIGIANLPNQRHKIVAKRGAAFTIMVCVGLFFSRSSIAIKVPFQCAANTNSTSHQVAGESGLGKTTFINTLFSTTIKNYADHKRRHQKQVDKTVEIEITKAELEEKFFKGMYPTIRGPVQREFFNGQLTIAPQSA